jgi:hypothetical protein
LIGCLSKTIIELSQEREGASTLDGQEVTKPRPGKLPVIDEGNEPPYLILEQEYNSTFGLSSFLISSTPVRIVV